MGLTAPELMVWSSDFSSVGQKTLLQENTDQLRTFSEVTYRFFFWQAVVFYWRDPDEPFSNDYLHEKCFSSKYQHSHTSWSHNIIIIIIINSSKLLKLSCWLPCNATARLVYLALHSNYQQFEHWPIVSVLSHQQSNSEQSCIWTSLRFCQCTFTLCDEAVYYVRLRRQIQHIISQWFQSKFPS